METHDVKPEFVVQRQLDAFNGRDLEAMLLAYANDAEMFEFPSKLLACGRDQLGERFAQRFREPNLHAQLKHRIAAGTRVIDHECVTRTFPEGPGEIDLVMIYEVASGRITKVWSIAGERRLFRQ